MKPTPNQIKTIDKITAYLAGWKTSNDIASPTHYCENREEAFDLAGNSDDGEDIGDALDTLLSLVQSKR